MFKKSGKTRGKRNGRFTFETMERRELMTANLGMAIEPIEAPVAAVASPAIVTHELTYLNNNTMASASQMGTVSTSVVYRGSVGGTDPVDYFKFRVANSGATTIQLAGLSRDVDIQILDSSGRVLASGTNGGTSSESLTVNLQAGVDYFIKVYPYGSGGVSNYQLTITAPRATTAPFDDTMPTANPLGYIMNTTRTFVSSVGGSDRVDYFRFTPGPSRNEVRSVNISLTGFSSNLNLEVLDSNGNVVARARGSSLSLSLWTNREYFIRVSPRSSAITDYRLSVTV